MIYFVRHGATNWNENLNADGKKDPRCQGRVDLELNKNGIAQAEKTAELIKDKHFDRVICSPLKRTRQTCSICYKGNTPIEYDDRIIERDFGEFEGLTRTEFDFNGFWNINANQNFKRAESIKDVETRVFALLDELKQTPNQDVLVVAHGGVGVVLMSYFMGVPQDGDYLSFEIPTGSVMSFDFKKNELSPSKE